MKHKRTTPSGLEITFEDGYPDAEGKTKRRAYTVQGITVPGVTTVLGILDKPGMRFAAEKLGVAGCIELAKSEEGLPFNVDGALSALKARELRHWQVWAARADLGTATHQDFVALAAREEVDESGISDDQRAFCAAIRQWAKDYEPEVVESEVMVGSERYGAAGRFDLLCRMNVDLGDTSYGKARVRCDLKTQSSPIKRRKDGTAEQPYMEHLLQLGGYELLARESGDEPSELQAVLRVDPEGGYDFTVSLVDPSDFLTVLSCYRALRGVKTASVSPALQGQLAA